VKPNSVSNPELGHLLKREPRSDQPAYELDLASIVCDILTRANDILPSEAGSIFIDDPLAEQRADRPGSELMLIAQFGELVERRVGSRLPSTRGIVGHVYATGTAYISTEPGDDPLFLSGFDGSSRDATHSLVCAPLTVEGSVIGVIELVNRLGGRGYDQRDLTLLEIFAQTTSAFIVNAIDAHRSKEMARRDELSGLYNDRYLHHALGQVVGEALAGGSDCGLVFLDLDHFKTVNDVHGHLAGSRVLSEVGAILRQILPGQAIAARYGGDEFVVVLPGAGPQELYWVAETVRKNIERFTFLAVPDPRDPVNYPALRLRGLITASVGIANLKGDVLPLFGPRATDAVAVKNEFIRLADAAMYVAKETGRNCTVTASTGATAHAPGARAESRARGTTPGEKKRGPG
jgi:diguanylate cyclase (GGDEF)-like protein